MLSPGFVTDVLGILLLLPFTRPVFRRLLAAAVGRRLVAGVVGGPMGATKRPAPGAGPVVRGDVVDRD
jgi:UPF0716 protein FxsA